MEVVEFSEWSKLGLVTLLLEISLCSGQVVKVLDLQTEGEAIKTRSKPDHRKNLDSLCRGN